MDINEPIINSELVDVIKRLKENNATQEEFFSKLSNAKLLCPIDFQLKNEGKEENKLVVGEGSTIQIKHLEDEKGKKYLMAFTDWGELQKWNKVKGQQTLILESQDYKTVMEQSKSRYYGMTINPFGENIIITLPMLENMENHKQVITKEEKVMVGIPSEYPTKMVNGLKDYFKENNLVDKAYLLWMVREEERSYLLVLDSLISPNQLYPQVGEFCKPYLNGKCLDIISARLDFGKRVIKDQSPFYIK